jgi:hypothetical protein
MAKVFISYSSGDSDFVKLARSQLQQQGIEVWLDQDDIRAGDSWRESIDEGISSSDAVIVVLSPRSSTSSYVTYEWAYALGKGAKVIPVQIEPTEVHERVETLQYLDFTDPRTRQWEKLFDAIVHRDRGALDIFLRDFPSSYMSDLHEARELWLVGVSLRDTVSRLQSVLERKLKRGHSLRVLLAEPLASVVEPAVRRTSKEQDLGDATEDKCREIRRSLRILRALQLDHSADDQLQIRTTRYPLGYGVHGMNPAEPDGALYVKLYPYKAEELEKPKFILRRDRDQWYDSFERELFALWQDGRQPLSTDTQPTQ